MISLQRHETLELVFDKLNSIRELCDESEGASMKSLRHAMGEIKRIAGRACEVIDAHEPAEDMRVCDKCGGHFE